MLLVVGVSDGLEELAIAAGAPAVLGWTGALTVDTDAKLQDQRDRFYRLDDDLVAPRVPEVVLIEEPVPARDQVGESHGLFVDVVVLPFRVGHAIALPVDLEKVQVVVLPPHCRLEDRVQFGQLDLSGHQQPTPDRGGVVHQRNTQLDDGLAWFVLWWSRHFRRLGEGQTTSSEVGPNLMITVGPNQVDIPTCTSDGLIDYLWPAGYRVRFDPTVLLDPTGKIVAHQGQYVTVGGGIVGTASWASAARCYKGGDVWAIQGPVQVGRPGLAP